MMRFGRRVELPDGSISNFDLDAPGGLGVTSALGGGAVLGGRELQGFTPHTQNYVVVEPSGEILAAIGSRIKRATSGSDGIEMHGSDIDEICDFTVRIEVGESQNSKAIWSFGLRNLAGRPAATVLPLLEFLSKLISPNSLQIRVADQVVAAIPITEEELPGETLLYRLTRSLVEVQEMTGQLMTIPNEVSILDLENIEIAERLLSGETVENSLREISVVLDDANPGLPDEPGQISDTIGVRTPLTILQGGTPIQVGIEDVTIDGAVLKERHPVDGAGNVCFTFEGGAESRVQRRLSTSKAKDGRSRS